jgi:fatty-acyl-CoA synthase
MPITEILAKNAQMYGSTICLTEINPALEENRDLSWKELALVETAHDVRYRKELTWRAFDERANQFANLLISRGVKRGDKVGILLMNCIEWLPIYFGVLKSGAIVVPLNFRYSSDEIKYALELADVSVLIFGSEFTERMQAIENDIPKVQTMFFVGTNCPKFAEGYESLASSQPRNAPDIVINDEDDAAIYFSSGTTGFPKGVMLTHHNIVNNGKCIGDRMDLSTADRFLIHVPMFHCFGMVLSMTASMTHGSTMSPRPYFTPKAALACVKQERITAINGVPTMFIAMLEHPDFSPEDFTHTRTGIMAGSPCPISVMRDVMDRMNMSEITIVFGQTESAPGCTMSSIDDPVEVRVGTVGRPLPGVE